VPKNPGCWANALDDCRGPLTGEHRISVAVWAAPKGQPNNRKSRMKRRLTFEQWNDDEQTRAVRELSLANLTERVLCDHHNGSSNDLDDEAGRFARAIEQWAATKKERDWLPKVRWNLRSYQVDGPLLERWFLKSAINGLFGETDLPIGSPDAKPGRPTAELVEMVYGRRPVAREAGAGIFLLTAVGREHRLEDEQFSLTYFDRNGTHWAGCVFSFRTLRFGVHFEARKMSPRTFDALPELRGSEILQPFNAMDSGSTNIEVRLRW